MADNPSMMDSLAREDPTLPVNFAERSWTCKFSSCTSHYTGYVSTLDQLEDLLQIFQLETHSCFAVRSTKRNFGKQIDRNKWQGQIHWLDAQSMGYPKLQTDWIPYIIMGTRIMECHHGPSRKRKKNQKLKVQEKDVHDYITKTRRRIQTSKKLGCMSKIHIRHIVKFPSYQLEKAIHDKYTRNALSSQIKKCMSEDEELLLEHQYHIQLPREHSNHMNDEFSDFAVPIHKELVSVIYQRVQEGRHSVHEMKVVLEDVVRMQLFKDKPLPPKTSTRYWPTMRQIGNHMLFAAIKRRDSCLDQDNLRRMTDEWARERPTDNIFFRPRSATSSQVPNATITDDEIYYGISVDVAAEVIGNRDSFLFVHQTDWQRELLIRYGSELCLLDATYRTNMYALPLFFLVVPTNVNYMVVGTFVTETEDASSISEALKVLRKWCPQWEPRMFLTDLSKAEISAIEGTFKDCGTTVHLSIFYTLQAWNRWLSASSNNVGNEKEQVMALMKGVADSECKADFDNNLKALQSSEVWLRNSIFRRWFERKWLANKERWVRFYRDNWLLVLNTMNGVARQSSTLKWNYLWAVGNQKSKTLSQLAHTIVTQFLPDSYRRYLRENISSSSEVRAYSTDIPLFLRDRPSYFVKHVMPRWEECACLVDNITAQNEKGSFYVRSNQREYLVKLDSGNGRPECSCYDWWKHHFPCKHLLAIIRSDAVPVVTWESLPDEYVNNPFICLHLNAKNNSSLDQYHDNLVDDEYQEDAEIVQTDDRKVLSAAKKICSVLMEIENLTYMCEDLSRLNEATEQLNVVKDQLL